LQALFFIMPKERAVFLIDGSNFYIKLRDLKLHQLLTFDFKTFAQSLIGDRILVKAAYYVGKVRTEGTEKARKMQADQQRLFAHLRNHKFSYSLGYLLRANNSYQEKGVDVQIAVDRLVAAYENLCERIYLVSSDTDLIPAIHKAQEKGKTVVYVGFSHQVSKALVANCRETQTLTKEALLPFIKQQQVA
jgi:uncharacterized LabA/DUF88 family protein